MSEWEQRMQSMLFLVFNDLRKQERGEPGLFVYEGTPAELRAMVNELEFALVPDRFAIEGQCADVKLVA